MFERSRFSREASSESPTRRGTPTEKAGRPKIILLALRPKNQKTISK